MMMMITDDDDDPATVHTAEFSSCSIVVATAAVTDAVVADTVDVVSIVPT